jgi:ADP-ribose pyrophosphatase YjhB (NUDIX family)
MAYREAAEECLVREMREETGLETEAGKLLFVHEYIGEPLHAVELFFEARITGGELITGRDPELGDNEQIICRSEFMNEEQISRIPLKMRHEILKKHMAPKDILDLRGYFRFH